MCICIYIYIASCISRGSFVYIFLLWRELMKQAASFDPMFLFFLFWDKLVQKLVQPKDPWHIKFCWIIIGSVHDAHIKYRSCTPAHWPFILFVHIFVWLTKYERTNLSEWPVRWGRSSILYTCTRLIGNTKSESQIDILVYCKE